MERDSRVTKIGRVNYFRVVMDCEAPKVWEAATLLIKNLRQVGCYVTYSQAYLSIHLINIYRVPTNVPGIRIANGDTVVNTRKSLSSWSRSRQ